MHRLLCCFPQSPPTMLRGSGCPRPGGGRVTGEGAKQGLRGSKPACSLLCPVGGRPSLPRGDSELRGTPPSLSLLSFNKRGRADRLQVALLLQFTRSPLPPSAWTTFPCFTDRELPLPLLKPCDTGMLLTNDLSQLGWQLFFLALRWCLTFNEIRFVNKDLSFFFFNLFVCSFVYGDIG